MKFEIYYQNGLRKVIIANNKDEALEIGCSLSKKWSVIEVKEIK